MRELILKKCKPSLNVISFVYLPMGHIRIVLWELFFHTKIYYVPLKENWTSILHKVASCSINQSPSLWHEEIKIQKSLTVLLFLNFLNVWSNTA